MKVLVVCERSQTVCKEFRKLGHTAFSCDIKKCYGEYPQWHILTDCLKVINGHTVFLTQDGSTHMIYTEWDMIIAHPQSAYLTKSGAQHTFNKDHTIKNAERLERGFESAKIFEKILDANCPMICVENPIPMKYFGLPAYTQIIHPYMFGHEFSSATCLWLKNLPKLKPTKVMNVRIPYCYWIRQGDSRNETFLGIAKAMAEQWGGYKK